MLDSNPHKRAGQPRRPSVGRGGIANNLPVDVARGMGVDLVIAVDIGTPLLDIDNITSVLALTGQMATLLTRRNTEEQR